MANTIGRFWYAIRSPKKGDPPMNAIVNIVPKVYSRNADGQIHLSPDLMTDGEIDWHIQAYKDDLDHVGRLAKRALRQANKKTLEKLSDDE